MIGPYRASSADLRQARKARHCVPEPFGLSVNVGPKTSFQTLKPEVPKLQDSMGFFPFGDKPLGFLLNQLT